MEKSNKVLPIMLATALATTPFLSAPKAFAVSKLSVSADNSKVGKESEYTFDFTLDEDLNSGDIITIDFDSDYDIASNISKSDVEVEGSKPKSVNVDGSTIEIKVNENFYQGDKISVLISSGITNPDTKGSYDVSVSTDNEDSDTDSVSISSSGSSSSDDFTVDVGDDEEDAESSYTIEEFDLDADLQSSDQIVVTFPDSDMLPNSIDTSDVEINGYEPDDVSVDSDEVTIDVPSEAKNDSKLEIKFLKGAGITNPSAGSDYTLKVNHEGDKYESDTFKIVKKSSSSSNTGGDSSFNVSLSDTATSARSSYSFEADFGKKELSSGDELTVEFPNSDMVPGMLTTSDITINGKTVKKASAYGNKVYLTAPSDFRTSSDVKVVFGYGAWITNPKTAGDYQLKMTVDGKTITSSKFTVKNTITIPTPTPTVPPVVTPTPVNNSTATIVMGKSTLNTVSGLTIGVKGLSVPLVRNRDFIEVVFPTGFKVPPYIAPANASVNGVLSSYVAVRGNNVLIYPAQDIPAGVAANVVIGTSSGLVTPAVKNVYSIGVYSSEEKGVLFARPVSIGGAPLPAATPTPQPVGTIPTNAAKLKLNVANYTLFGKTYPLSAAPFAANGTTMVPAQFFREGLQLTTNWDTQTVAIISGMNIVKFTAGSNQARVGNKTVTLPTAVQWKNGMPMIPLKFVADNLGYKTGVDAKTATIFIYR